MSSFGTEMWSWYALTVLIVGARFLSRRMLFKSFKALQADDWLMLFTLAVHTGLLVVTWIQTYTPTNLINPADNIVLTPDEIKRREYGSKLVLVTEHLSMIVLWCCKGCLLILYSRLTMSLKHNVLVKIVAGYVVVSFIVMEILWFVWCRPFHDYWKMAPADLNCSAETNHMITNAVFNISTDIMIIFLPMPVLFQSQLPLKRKLTLASVFALGSFTILAACLSKYYSLGSPYGTAWIYWYIREVSTAIITANLPLTWTLLQKIFGMSSFLSRSGKSSKDRTTDAPNRLRSAYGNLTSRTRENSRPKKPDPHAIDISPSESQEQINTAYDIPLKIWQQHEVHVTTQEVESKHSKESLDGPHIKDIDDGAFTPRERPMGDDDRGKRLGDVEMGLSTKVSRGL